MNKKIIIHQPVIYTCESEFFKKAVRLAAVVDCIDENENLISNRECYYEFDNKYAEYLVDDRSDAFVLGLLSMAMENGEDIECEAPLSERLYFQLTEQYIPMVGKYNSLFPMRSIKLSSKTICENIVSCGGVATGCSGGVDSFYTIEKYRDTNINKLTHLVCSSSGTLDHDDIRIRHNYKKLLDSVYKIGNEADLQVIGCYNNIYEFYSYPYKSFHTFFTTTFCSVPYALNKLISVYYANSGMPIDAFTLDITTIKDRDCSSFDIFTTQLISTNTLTVYSSGQEVTRNEKVKYIANSQLASNNLSVCGIEMDGAKITNGKINCSKCKKCLRTMLSLYTIGKLNNYKSAFDVEDFIENKIKYIGSIIAYDHVEFTQESFENAKENGIKIPKASYLYAYFVFIPLEFLRKTLRRFTFIKQIGYKLGLDYYMHGYRRGKN